ncbi:MAG TPA: hypothetical protein VGJ77_09340 [Gaiellaceae bacterium]|jgi:hypothetical protein
MQGYEVVTSDDHKIGHVVDERDDCVIVEHGHIFKAKHAIPKTFAHVDDVAGVVRATITKDVFTDGPKVTDDWDCNAVLEHYGLVGGLEHPDTEGYGETLPTDPAETADDSDVAQRAAMREGTADDGSTPAVHERSRSALDPTGPISNQ